jgi:hypothetical protein
VEEEGQVSPTQKPHDAADRFGGWLRDGVIAAARGDGIETLGIDPGGRFWLGTLVSEELQMRLDRGERGERLDPSAVGLRFLPIGEGPWTFGIAIEFRLWLGANESWRKSDLGYVEGSITIDPDGNTEGPWLKDRLRAELDRLAGGLGLSAEVRTAVEWDEGRPTVEVTLVNDSPEKADQGDTRMYETKLSISGIDTDPFLLESLPDSFRYDRRLPALGINCGVEQAADGTLSTSEIVSVEQRRPSFWNADEPPPDLRFRSLADEPLAPIRTLVDAHRRWGDQHWSSTALAAMSAAQGWTDEMEAAAALAQSEFEEEHRRLASGLRALETDEDLRRSFQLMNEALIHSSRGRYDGWRPFQIGFVLVTGPAVRDPAAERFADIVWFSTGGGKTETYLGLVMWAALFDRMTGKTTGVTGWSRFPLRLLSLQQTQRFADAMAGAELVRRRHELGGEPFSVGFLVGEGATPNRIQEDPTDDWRPDPEDDAMPARFQVLMVCPFCFGDDLAMAFDHSTWTLEHRCNNPKCPWPEVPLPFYVVDDEIYRFLPTVVVGTLDKIASISIQASMAGLFGPPRGTCPGERHGHVYAKRSTKPQGCLVPGCDRPFQKLPMARERYGPTFRLQDELHLLRDSLGAVDAHYEALMDHLQRERTGTSAKILGSSATLSGYEHQTEVLYRMPGRVFPAQGPSASIGFWTAESEEVSRRHVALAPRGATLEFANDRIVTVLQQSIRRLRDEPAIVCAEAGVDVAHAQLLLDLFGTTVVYGNTIRDLDAAARSLETQVPVDGPLNTATLTGQTDFEEVRTTLERLQDPEDDFDDRIHVVTASSMMSHGVDIDRLNTMVVLGLPLTTAEYIQTTARVGRGWPGLVFVLHKMARERDASTYRSWPQFVRQGDRFVEPIPITRRSKRVLERTAAGLLMGRLLHVHEMKWGKALTTVKSLREYAAGGNFDLDEEFDALVDLLRIDDPMDEPVRVALAKWLDEYFENLDDTTLPARFPSELCSAGHGPMRSLRDVEQQAPVRDIMIEEVLR